MRFVGKPNGKLMKGSPSNYVHGEIYQMSFNNSKFPFWKLVEEEPVLKVPEDTDSIYEESIYVPEDGLGIAPEPVEHPEDVNIDPTTDATIEPYMNFNTSTGQLSSIDVTTTEDPIPEDVEKPPKTRPELKTILDDAGVVYKKGARTTTLQGLVDKLVSEE